mmetsp:Transcript_14588/g.31739  ORF Transcript_14588/g.31739 Transcript_14588/m.31739 type:complete len:712 (+) Transcript_14588:46-2181(+)
MLDPTSNKQQAATPTTMAMATEPMCDCRLSHLLKRSIGLIDPYRSSGNSDNATATDSPSATSAAQTRPAVAVESESKSVDGSRKSTAALETCEKKVRFSESCSPPRKLISACDAIQAYDLLMHAASIISSSPLINASTSWERLTHITDIYRALIVTSCLLLELLPQDLPSKNNDAINNDNTQHDHTIQPTTTKSQQKCPLQCIDDPPCIPSLSPAIEKQILSTSRRCILLLQALEKICAAKTIAQRHSNSHVQTIAAITAPVSASIYEGGDDIHDYDRSTSDFISNYDWHDDGFLPLPFSSIDGENDKAVSAKPEYCSDDYKINQNRHSSKPSNILEECCYRPQHPTDPPSSKHEKNAWTRDWICGERIVSLRLEDYQYYDQRDSQKDNNSDVERVDGGEMDRTNNEIADNETSDVIHDLTAESNYLTHTNEVNSSEMLDEDDIEEGHVSLNISPEVLAEEEECLLNMVLAGGGSSSNHSRSSRLFNARERRKRKRQKKKHAMYSEKQDTTNNPTSHINQIHAKEGFLLLVCEDIPHSILQYLKNHDESNQHQSSGKTKTIRIFARLHPSGWLSIEDRSIRHRDCNQDIEELSQQPLTPRTRYLDLFIGLETKCQPCVPEGTSSFHFRLNCISLLGASSLSQSFDNNDNGNHCKCQTSLNNTSVDLLFGVDEGTGGDFMDGFDWVNTLSGASTASSLPENIRSESGEEFSF